MAPDPKEALKNVEQNHDFFIGIDYKHLPAKVN